MIRDDGNAYLQPFVPLAKITDAIDEHDPQQTVLTCTPNFLISSIASTTANPASHPPPGDDK